MRWSNFKLLCISKPRSKLSVRFIGSDFILIDCPAGILIDCVIFHDRFSRFVHNLSFLLDLFFSISLYRKQNREFMEALCGYMEAMQLRFQSHARPIDLSFLVV